MKFLVALVALLSALPVRAEVLDIDIALNNTKAACSGISEKLTPLKTMAGRTNTPDLYSIMSVMGGDMVKERIGRIVK